MTERLVLVDTSAFIEALRGDGDRVVRERVDELLARDRAAVCGPVVAELLIGTRHEAEYRLLDADLRSRHNLVPPADLWRRVARLGYDLRRQGQTVPITDLAIAVVAMHNDAALLHRDRHFALIAEACDLEQEYVGPPEPSEGEA